jgi:hypothetical protein
VKAQAVLAVPVQLMMAVVDLVVLVAATLARLV